MKDSIATGKEAGLLICKVLGLSNVTNLTLHCPVNGLANVEVNILVTSEEANQISEVIKKYELKVKDGE